MIRPVVHMMISLPSQQYPIHQHLPTVNAQEQKLQQQQQQPSLNNQLWQGQMEADEQHQQNVTRIAAVSPEKAMVTPPTVTAASSIKSSAASLPIAPALSFNNDINVNKSLQNQQQPLASGGKVLPLEEFAEVKKRLSVIMRDFHDKKIHFFAADNINQSTATAAATELSSPKPVYTADYQLISQKVKQDEEITKYLKGEMISFLTPVDKRKKAVTEMKLFMPEFATIVPSKSSVEKKGILTTVTPTTYASMIEEEEEADESKEYNSQSSHENGKEKQKDKLIIILKILSLKRERIKKEV
jgi:hypothetical protein